MKPANFTKVVSNKKTVFGLWALTGYIGHFFLIIIGINLFSDGDRLINCAGSQYPRGE
jgi:hypothetical protein